MRLPPGSISPAAIIVPPGPANSTERGHRPDVQTQTERASLPIG